MYKIFILMIALTISIYAKPLYSFSNVNVNYLDWGNSTQNKTTQEDFGYIGVEGGAGWEGGEFYGNANLENPTKKYTDEYPDDLRYTVFTDFDINIKDGFRLHFQDFYLKSKTFHVNDFVAGLAYKYQSDFGLWIRPFIGVHHTKDSFYDGLNGYMAGWTFNYNFQLFEENLSLFNWNELEFGRDKSFYEDNGEPTGDGKNHGLNGALSLWWNINESYITGLQYRYAEHKLGFSEYQSALIYTFKYNF